MTARSYWRLKTIKFMRWIFSLVILPLSLAAQESAVVEIRGSDVRAVRFDDSLHDPVELPLVMSVPAGFHEVHIYGNERVAYPAMDYSERFRLVPGERRIFDTGLGRLGMVNSIPHGAAVWLEDSLAGETPLWLALGRLQDRPLLFKKSGYQDTRVIVADTAVAANLLWIRLKPTMGYVEPDNEFLSESWRNRGVGRHRGWLILSGIAAVVTGGVAAYYKIKADDLFEKAKLAHRQNDFATEASLRKKTKRYDRYATVGFVGLQISFGAGVFLFLKSE